MQRQKSKGIFLASGDGIDNASHVHAISQEQATTMKTLHELCLDTMHSIPHATIESSSHTPPHMVLDDPACKYAWLTAHEDDGALHVDLALWPGDGLSQARELYRALNLDMLQTLEKNAAWYVEPQMRFFYLRKGLYECVPKMPFAEFCAYWSAHIEFLQQVRRDGDSFEVMISWLQESEFIGEGDAAQLHRLYCDTKREHMNAFPGLHMRKRWEATDVEEDSVRFTRVVEHALAQAQSCWSVSNFGLTDRSGELQ